MGVTEVWHCGQAPQSSMSESRNRQGLGFPAGGRGNLDEQFGRLPEGEAGLRVTPVVDGSHLLHARNGAARSAVLPGVVLVLDVLTSVLLEGNGRIAPLL